jgi:signal transduction histidine kinase
MKLWQNFVPSFKNIKNILRYLEWILLLTTIPASLSYGVNTTKLCIFLIAFALMSCIFPINRPLWIRQGYILLGIFLVCLSTYATRGDNSIDLSIMIFFYIAKSCFLLDRQSVFLTATFAMISYLSISLLFIPSSSEIFRASEVLQKFGFDMKMFVFASKESIIANYLSTFISGSAFAILFSYTIIAERESRQKAEFLTQKVEDLAASLERTRIARDIHDSLGHTLTSLQIQLAVAQKFRQRNLDKTFEAVDLAKSLVDRCIEDVKRALKTMRESNFNLDRALETLIDRHRQNTSLTINSLMSLPKLSLQVSHNLYCIVKEALINIEKHSHATYVRLSFYTTESEILLEMEDNGIGFEEKQFYSGYGIKGMKERVQLLDGKMTIDSVRDRGTKIRIIMPR